MFENLKPEVDQDQKNRVFIGNNGEILVWRPANNFTKSLDLLEY